MSKNHLPDIDLDLPTTFNPIDVFPQAIPASMVKDENIQPHPCGVYLQPIPQDKLTGLAAIPYEEAEELGYFKMDFLHLTLLDYFSDKNQMRQLLEQEPDWNLLQIPSVVMKLFQLSKHYDILTQIKPQSVQELADVIALIRPSKKYLINRYMSSFRTSNVSEVRKELYTKTKHGGVYFKKAHAIAYAMTIVLQLHLIKEGRV